MAFKMTSEKHGTVRIHRHAKYDELYLIFGDTIKDGRPYLHRHVLTENEGYAEISVPYLNELRGAIHDEHVDRARAMRDRLDNDTAFIQWLDDLAKKK